MTLDFYSRYLRVCWAFRDCWSPEQWSTLKRKLQTLNIMKIFEIHCVIGIICSLFSLQFVYILNIYWTICIFLRVSCVFSGFDDVFEYLIAILPRKLCLVLVYYNLKYFIYMERNSISANGPQSGKICSQIRWGRRFWWIFAWYLGLACIFT